MAERGESSKVNLIVFAGVCVVGALIAWTFKSRIREGTSKVETEAKKEEQVESDSAWDEYQEHV